MTSRAALEARIARLLADALLSELRRELLAEEPIQDARPTDSPKTDAVGSAFASKSQAGAR